MENMISYVQENQETFEECMWNEVDSLVLCQLAYLKFEGLVPRADLKEPFRRSRERVTIKSLDRHPQKANLFRDERYAETNRALWEALVHSSRFQNMELDYAVDEVDVRTETQFSAVTCFLPNKTVYVAFRGTDESIIGWKEDFNLAFSKPVPAQEKSVIYLNQAVKRLRRPVYVGGHSKGGNLAIYSAMYCRKEIKNRIVQIYSMDGPGFREETLIQGHYEMIADRVKKILPHSSLVGMLFEKGSNFEIVESKATGLSQHDPMTWVVHNGAFEKNAGLFEPALFFDTTINDWLNSLDEEKTRIFVNALFDVLYATESDNLIDLNADRKKAAQKVLNAVSELDEETKAAIKGVIRAFFDMGKVHMRAEMQEWFQHVKNRL